MSYTWALDVPAGIGVGTVVVPAVLIFVFLLFCYWSSVIFRAALRTAPLPTRSS